MKVILIGHKAQQGKDTFANMICHELEEHGQVPFVIHFADFLKLIAKEFYGWDGVKDEQGRTLLQSIGNDIRNKDEHFWTDFVARYVKTFDIDDIWIIIPDWRHKEEHARMLEYFDYDDVITVDIKRRNSNFTRYYSPDMTEEQRQHKSEVDLDDYVCQYCIINDTLGQLALSAQVFVEDILNGGHHD